MKSRLPANLRKLPAEALVLSGICLFGGFTLALRALFGFATRGPVLRPAATSGSAAFHYAGVLATVTPVVLFISTFLTLVGTISLLRRRPATAGAISLADVGFVAIGVIASGVGVWFTAGVVWEVVLGR
jgi:hypothetical protein